MPASSTKHRNLLSAFAFFLLILVSLRTFKMSGPMDSLPKPFTVEIDGKPINKADANAEDRTHAKVGSEPAVFELKDKRLHCDGYILARSQKEDRSLLPKQVMWFKADTDEPTHDVTAKKEGGDYTLLFASMWAAVVLRYASC